jgi:hypothetical protein
MNEDEYAGCSSVSTVIELQWERDFSVTSLKFLLFLLDGNV